MVFAANVFLFLFLPVFLEFQLFPAIEAAPAARRLQDEGMILYFEDINSLRILVGQICGP